MGHVTKETSRFSRWLVMFTKMLYWAAQFVNKYLTIQIITKVCRVCLSERISQQFMAAFQIIGMIGTSVQKHQISESQKNFRIFTL